LLPPPASGLLRPLSKCPLTPTGARRTSPRSS
jgi:hypothetical protein